MDIQTCFAVLAFGGGILSILGGWGASGEPWSNRKALVSLIAGIAYAAGVGLASGGQSLTWFTGGTVALSGMAANLWGKDLWSFAKKAATPPALS